MKLRFYLRGLGVGIAVTGLILMFVGSQRSTMSDEEVKARASELGMVENQTLAELNKKQLDEMSESPKPTVEPTTAPTEEPTVSPTDEATATPTEEPTPTPTEEPTPAQTEEPTPAPTVEPTTEPTIEPTAAPTVEPATSGEKVVISIHAGDGSGTVANRVKEAGLCESASEFDKFLMEKGYDKTLRVGNHEIDKSMTWDEIGATLCGR